MATTTLCRPSLHRAALVSLGLLISLGLSGGPLPTADAALQPGSQRQLTQAAGRLASTGHWLVTDGVAVGVEIDRLGNLPPSAAVLLVQVNVTRATKAGTLRLGARGGARPASPQIAFPAGSSTTTTLLSRTAAEDLLAWSTARVRVQLTAMSDLPGQTLSTELQSGQTNLINPLVVLAARPAPHRAITLEGAWWTVPVLGQGSIPVNSVSAVWLSVQIKGSKVGTGSFATASAGHPRLGLVSISPNWTTSLVLAAVDSTGAIGFSLKSGVISQSRLVVVGWVAAADAATGSVKPGSQLMSVTPKLLKTVPLEQRQGLRLVRVKLPTTVISPTVSAVLVQARVKTNRAGRLRVGRTASAATKANAQASHLPAKCQGTVMLRAPLGKGRRTYLAVPPGMAVDRLIVVGYITANGS